MRLDESFLNDLARDNLVEQPMRIDIEGVAPPSAPGEVDLTQTATEMAAGVEPPGATPMTMGEFATTVADAPAGLLKGAVQGTVGLPGDIESLTYGVRELFNRRADEGALDAFLRGLEQKTILPTTENVKKWLDENVGTLVPAGASERRTEAAKIPEFVGELGGAGKTVIGASKAAGRGLGQVTGASADMAARTPAMQAGSVKPSAFMPNQAAPAAEPQRSDIGFYSAVEKAVLDSKQDKGTGAQFLAQITKTQGVKPEELKWTGLDEFLKGKKSVTKQEIQDYLNANRVDVQEVRLDRSLPVVQAERRGAFAAYDRGEITLEQRNAILEQSEPVNTRHHLGAYQGIKTEIPGGENYREILLTLPDTKGARLDARRAEIESKGRNATDAEKQEWASIMNQLQPETRDVEGLSPFRNRPEFRSTHFQQPNILAHMRVNDRVVDGKKTLFIEEIQSDWHQAGRKKGYAGADTKNAEAAFKQYSQELADKYNLNPEQNLSMYATMKGMQPEEVAKYDELQSAWVSSKGGVPDAPFKTSWHELTLKRAIQEASEKGYDQIAFTTGKTQAERYDLSKQVDELFYWQNRLIAAKNQRSVFDKSNVSPEQLENFVGKDVAKKLLESKPDNVGARKLFGEDLQVGGEGMKGFYDNILPKSLEKLGKKFNAKVGKTEMDGVEVWQMDITPKMRETVTKQGQPLFQIGVGGGAAAGAATMQQPGEQM